MNGYTLEDLMNTYGQDVWNFAFSICKNRQLADDIAQDVFLQAYRHVASFRGESSVKTWLLKITRNISYNNRKSAFVRKVMLVDFVHRAGQSQSAEDIFLEQEAANEVWLCVFRLPVKFREVIVLDAKYHLSVSEIAGVLNISEGTVKSRLHRARKKMTGLLYGEGQRK
ncbi:sigma-70 family RNA polymerase sigma factor [Paenibacillus sp. N10]|uniref:RNA polymerase sigma factor n=2 Tax=Paenibacillus lutrae TaxID=2078573 RepID=A0A7X3JZM0_9BACL|nr:sigma-70 family RNA polymerase sigma factor [Paenibacillus lutrae]MVP00324.1 sigma-70 family RNA polymerase sigma factor [Paenibacillus lutrae]